MDTSWKKKQKRKEKQSNIHEIYLNEIKTKIQTQKPIEQSVTMSLSLFVGWLVACNKLQVASKAIKL